jgi:hypothetical protein
MYVRTGEPHRISREEQHTTKELRESASKMGGITL